MNRTIGIYGEIQWNSLKYVNNNMNMIRRSCKFSFKISQKMALISMENSDSWMTSIEKYKIYAQ